MSTFSRKSSRLATWIAVPAALVAAGIVVSSSSYAAFSDTTANEGNSWRAGTVQLDDDAAGRAMFAVPDAKPGDSGAHCITVTSTGSLASDVRLYAMDASGSNDLPDHLALVVENGSGGGFGTCDGFQPEGEPMFRGTMAQFTAAHSSFGQGVPAWTPTGAEEESRTFRFSWQLVEDAPNGVQGGTASATFVWEAQNS